MTTLAQQYREEGERTILSSRYRNKQLLAWSDRVFDAKTLKDIFKDSDRLAE
jgi:hypothetical protein